MAAVDMPDGEVEVELRIRFPVDDAELNGLHARAFGRPEAPTQRWAVRLQRHSLAWIGAFDADALVGFVNVCWDGGAHAFVLDTVVEPWYRRRGIGRRLVEAAVAEAAGAGCDWLHADFEAGLDPFYLQACGFRRTSAGIRRLQS